MIQLADKLQAVGKVVSVAIDNATHPNVDLEMLRAHPGIGIITMSSYDSNMTIFENVVDGGVSSGVDYSAWLSASHISWGDQPPSRAAIEDRVAYLESHNVSSVSIFGDWEATTNDSATLLNVFAPVLQRFLHG